LQASPEFEKPSPTPMCNVAGFEHFFLFKDSCYYFVEEAKAFDEAESDCKNRGAHLVSIGDRGSELFSLNTIKASDAWIGLTNKKV
jgi:Lectin C-type domain